ncbi:MAG: FAD-dependent oxidoreductase [Planctomycetota bacterium]
MRRGGGSTGVFAAVAAARMGARVAIVEMNGFLGGTATAAMVCIWHSILDARFERRIIGGLTSEVIDRLRPRGAVTEAEPNEHLHYVLNTEELKIELDELAAEHDVRTFLHALFVQPVVEDGRVTAAIIEDKSGRRAIRAKVFVDASGDGDLVARAGLPLELRDDLQPPTVGARFHGIGKGTLGRIRDAVFAPEFRDRLPHGFMWGAAVPGIPDEVFVAGTRAPGADCSDADSLAQAEIEGRRQVRAIMDIARERVDGCDRIALAALGASIGIRETRHARCLHTLTEEEVLSGARFADAIASGSYRVDVHHSGRPGLTFRYLDGREEYVAPGRPVEKRRWRPETDSEGDADPTFYQIPYRSLVPEGSRNCLVAGRVMGADRGAYGAVGVMVNCNQTGEAAGAAAALAADGGLEVADIDTDALRRELAARGAVVI